MLSNYFNFETNKPLFVDFVMKNKKKIIEKNIYFIFIYRKYAMSVAAACVAETVTYPLDLTKTRLIFLLD